MFDFLIPKSFESALLFKMTNFEYFRILLFFLTFIYLKVRAESFSADSLSKLPKRQDLDQARPEPELQQPEPSYSVFPGCSQGAGLKIEQPVSDLASRKWPGKWQKMARLFGPHYSPGRAE